MKIKKYQNAQDFMRALSDRLKQKEKLGYGDIQTMRRQVAFDRLLVRLFSREPSLWVLKGGYALEIRIDNSRTTKDIDLELRDQALASSDKEIQNNTVLMLLRELAGIDTGDFFSFRIKNPVMDLAGPPYGGARFPVIAYTDNRVFAKFHVDVGVGDALVEPFEVIIGKDWLGFAGFHTKGIPALSIEQHFAEKLHAYTLPRGNNVNSRTKDLIDMILLIHTKKMNNDRIKEAVTQVFACRKSHQLPQHLNPPPHSWSEKFEQLAKECQLNINMDAAFDKLNKFAAKILLNRHKP